MRQNDPPAGAETLLRETLEDALASRADSVEFEVVPGGLEITAFWGPTGCGFMFEEHELIDALLELVSTKTRRRKSFEVALQGKPTTVYCQWYQSFGEWRFRLRFKKRRRRADT